MIAIEAPLSIDPEGVLPLISTPLIIVPESHSALKVPNAAANERFSVAWKASSNSKPTFSELPELPIDSKGPVADWIIVVNSLSS